MLVYLNWIVSIWGHKAFTFVGYANISGKTTICVPQQIIWMYLCEWAKSVDCVHDRDSVSYKICPNEISALIGYSYLHIQKTPESIAEHQLFWYIDRYHRCCLLVDRNFRFHKCSCSWCQICNVPLRQIQWNYQTDCHTQFLTSKSLRTHTDNPYLVCL